MAQFKLAKSSCTRYLFDSLSVLLTALYSFDSDWYLHTDLQAQVHMRCISQTKVVRILQFITKKSMEETVFVRARCKLSIDNKVIKACPSESQADIEGAVEPPSSILEADREEENEEVGNMNDVQRRSARWREEEDKDVEELSRHAHVANKPVKSPALTICRHLQYSTQSQGEDGRSYG